MKKHRALSGLSAAALLALAGAAHGQLVVGVDEENIPVSVYNLGTGVWSDVFQPDDAGNDVSPGGLASDGVEAIACDDVSRKIYWASGSNLYVVDYDSMNAFGRRTSAFVADIAHNGSVQSIAGLTFANGVLYASDASGTSTATSPEGIYSVDVTTGATTMVLDLSSAGLDIQGIAYNPLDNLFYGVNDSSGSELVSIDVFGSGAVASVTPFPATTGGSTDVDGVALGVVGGEAKVFFIHDQQGEYGVYNLTTGLLETSIPSAPGILVDETFSGGCFCPDLVEPPVDDDLRITLDDAPDPIVPGNNITYSLRVRNAGSTTLTNVDVATTLSGLTTYVSSDFGGHDGAVSGGVHTASFASIPPLFTETYQIVVSADTAGTATATAVGTLDQTDPDPSNNTATQETGIGEIADLVVTISDAPDPINTPTTQLTYTIQLTNNGPSDAENVVLSVNLPPESTFDVANAGTHDGSAMGGTHTVTYPIIFSGFSQAVSIRVITGANGNYVATATATADELDPTPDDATASTSTLVDYSADLAVDLQISTGVAVGAGDPVHFFLDVTNAGPAEATNAMWSVTLPDEVSFLATNAGFHDGSPTGGVVSGTIVSLANGGLSEAFIQTLTTGTLGDVGSGIATVAAGSPPDDNQADNTSTTRPLLVVATAAGYPTLVMSDDFIDLNYGPQDKSIAPDLGGRLISGFDKPFISPDGAKWIINVDLADATTDDETLVVFNGSMLNTVVQEGVTLLTDQFDLVGLIDQKLGINDNGEYVFATNTDATTSDEVIVKGGGAGHIVIAREGNTFPDGNFFFLYGGSLESPSITNSGAVYFLADTDDPTTTIDEYFVSTADDGLSVTPILQEGVDSPGNQTGGGFELWGEWDIDDTWVTGDGAHYLQIGDLDGPTLTDDVAAYDNSIVIQENVLVHPDLGDSADDATAVDAIFLAHNGDWYARGSNNNNTHWVLKNGAPIAVSGQPLFPGSTENWAASDPSGVANPTFFFVVGDHRGNYVVGGFIDSPFPRADTALVLNGERVVSREFDPIDLDGNGFFDDSPFHGGGPVFIHTYGNDDGIITADGRLLVTTQTRTVVTDNTGDVLLSIDLGLGASCPCEFDGNDAQVNVFDLLAYLDLWFANAPGADIDGTPGVNVFDLLAFLDCWFPASAGSPCP